LRGEQAAIRDEIFGEINYHVAYEPLRCIRTPRYKLIRYFGDHDRGIPVNCDDSPSKDILLENGYFERPREREMLFDLYFDPAENANLAETPSYKPVVRDLSSRLQKWMEQTGDPILAGQVPRPKGSVVGDVGMVSPSGLS
jgi:hypothetical protein